MNIAKRLFIGALYVAGCILFVGILAEVQDRIREFSRLHFSFSAALLAVLITPFAVSVIFSWEHIKKLLFQRDRMIRVKYSRLVAAFFFGMLVVPIVSFFKIFP